MATLLATPRRRPAPPSLGFATLLVVVVALAAAAGSATSSTAVTVQTGPGTDGAAATTASRTSSGAEAVAECQMETADTRSGATTGCPRVAHSVSFVATSNQEALKANKVKGELEPLEAIMKGNLAFRLAFTPEEPEPTPKRRPESAELEEEDEEEDFVLPYRGRRPARGVNATIIRGSGGEGIMARPAQWGLVSAIVEAYNNHHELVLRPDDLWQAILTQFSFYVNKHAEELRDRFVDFQGKKTLVVTTGGTLFTADYARLAQRMVHENILTNVKDPSIVEWLLPQFSTTTWTDKVAASVTLMSTLQAYFEYAFALLCGIPKVTLLGVPEDWRLLRAKADRLLDYDLQEGHMAAWHKLLAPVLDEFVKSAEGHASLEFWDRVCSRHSRGSGPRYLSGWVTVFAVFSDKGEWHGISHLEEDFNADAVSVWPLVDFDDLPVGVVSVPVLVDDNGVQYDAQLLAGQFAFEDYGSDGVALQPRTDWCFAYSGEPKAEPRAYRHGEVREG